MDKRKLLASIHVIIICVLLNLAGRSIATSLSLPFWLDSIGTIAAAVTLGPIAGALCGLLLNVIISALTPESLPYMVVSIAIGLSVGFFYPKKKASAFRAVSSMVMTGLISAIISTPLNIVMYDGVTGNEWGDTFMDMISNEIHVQVIITFLGEAFVDIPDKVVSFVVAFALIQLVSLINRRHRMAVKNIKSG